MPRLENVQNRAAGEYVSPSTPAPARGPNQATKFIATVDMPQSAMEDPDLLVRPAIESTVDGVNYTEESHTTWQGGNRSRDGLFHPPTVGWVSEWNRTLTRVRVRWTQSKSARTGASVEFEARDFSPTSVG